MLPNNNTSNSSVNACVQDKEHLKLVSNEQLMQKLILLHGQQSSAYFHFQDDVEHFIIQGIGFISYFQKTILFSKVNIIFCNPICPPSNLKHLFTEFFAQSNIKTIILGIDKSTAMVLETLGYRSNHIGPEYWISIKEYKIQGKSMKYLRWARNMGKRGFVVKEQSWAEVDAKRVHEISHKWRNTKLTKHQEVRLLTRPPEFKDAWKVRKFYCYKDEKLVGFVFFDPYFKNGKIIGYCANILRSDPSIKPDGFLDYIIIQAMDVFRNEGIELLSLGLSPFHNITKVKNDRLGIRLAMKSFYQFGNFLYAFKKLAFHKTRYRSQKSQWYACTKGMSLPRIILICLLSLNVL